MNNEIKNEKESEIHIEQSAKKEDVLSEQEHDKNLAGTLAGKKPPTESDNNSGKEVVNKPPETDNPEGKPETPKNPEEKVASDEERDAAIAGKLAEQKPPQESDNNSENDEGDKPPPTDNPESKGQPENPPKTDVHTEQKQTEIQLEKLATAKVGQEVKKTGTETGGESNPDKPPADTSNAIVKGTEVQQTEAKGEDKPLDTENDDKFQNSDRRVKGENNKNLENSNRYLYLTDDEIKKLQTEENSAYFWSGLGPNGPTIAADIAKSNNGVTLESTVADKGIELKRWDFDNLESIKQWEEASDAYATQVKGEVHAVVGENLRKGNIWENIELPKLQNNPNVTKITLINPQTMEETIIFKRSYTDEDNGNQYIY